MRLQGTTQSFREAVVTVLTGTVVAQAIPIAVSPVLTRLYSPADFGFYSYFLASVSFFSVVATLRLELAIVLPRRNFEAVLLAIGAVAVATAVSGVLLLTYLGLDAMFDLSESMGPAYVWGYVLPASIFLGGLYQVASYWMNRRGRYRRIAVARVTMASCAGGAQVVGGLFGASAGGLIVGYIVGALAAVTAILRSAIADRRHYARRSTPPLIGRMLLRYSRFAGVMVPGQLASIASTAAPVLLLGVAYGPAVAGFYGLAERVLFAPVAVIGTAVGDVYRQHASELYKTQGQCRAFFMSTALRLALIASIPLVTLVVAGPWLFEFVFGESWVHAGRLAQLMAIPLFFQLVSTPLSHTLLFAGLQRWDMFWQFGRLAVAVVVILGARVFSEDYRVAVGALAGGLAGLYLLHSLMQFRAASGSKGQQAP